ncbi:TolC family protein [Candidatus Poribacteria bacterium]|nr:TolC family protein [Candidatus Poribacteria bacterium]
MDWTRLQCRLFIGLLLFIASFAEAETRLTLEGSIEIAQKNNLSIQSQQEKVKSAEAQVRAARANMLANLSINGNYTYFKDLPKLVLKFSGDGFPLPPQAGGDGADSPTTELEFGAHRNFTATLSLRQPIFAWGRYANAYRSAKLELEAARKELEAYSHRLTLEVTEAFYDVLLAVEFVKVAQQTVDLVDKQLQTAKVLSESGAATHFDVLRAEVQFANTKSQLIRAQNQVSIAEDMLKNVLNMELHENIRVNGSFALPQVELDLGWLIQTAIEKRSEIYQLDFNEQAAGKRVAVAKTRNRPDLSFFANYQVDDNERLAEMNRIWNVGFQINIPLFDGFAARATVQGAESGLRQIQLAKHQTTDAVELEVRIAYLNLLQSKALIATQKETVEQAQESVRLANLRYTNGMITSVELTDAQLALAQAEVNRLQAQHGYIVGLARLEKAIGQKLGN